MVAIFAYAVLNMLLLVSDLALRSFWISDGETTISPLVAAVIEHLEGLDTLLLVLLFGYLVGFFLWRLYTRNMLSVLPGGAGEATVHWRVGARGHARRAARRHPRSTAQANSCN